ncbi:ATPase, T2SS/T4P/T4SS family [Amaricoccus solimangrovi]|uniref:Type VI secretion protein n=1 Tax=Amaricoccus solimangrovi TaxID=2589815 RepID=A0A501WCI4_9RHOB|nr:ATPase, T2SS/T4P/T4SS family [Amaricoccus solimangrovi]TPE47309.1 type VI secretion protein [Amaricoccus solimangrovi]
MYDTPLSPRHPALTSTSPASASHAEHELRDLRELLVSDAVNEVVVNPDGAVWIERAEAEHMVATAHRFAPERLRRLADHLAGETGNRIGPRHPLVSGSLRAFGQALRVQVVVPPAVEDGAALSIRKYVARVLDLGEIGFLAGHQVSVEGERRARLAGIARLAREGRLAELFDRAIGERMNILVSGGTSSGKTTVARALLARADPAERLVTIEDARELHPPHPNAVALIAERLGDSERSPAQLLVSALRMRPDRLILGEMRGPEALAFLEAINTGHPGSISTIHADSPVLALERLALMVMRAGAGQTRADVLDYATRTLDLIVQVGRRDGRRGVLEVFLPALAD